MCLTYALLSALRRSSAVVGCVRLSGGAAHFAAVVSFLWRQRDVVRAVDADIPDLKPDEEDAGIQPSRSRFFGVLSRLHRVTELRLHLVDVDFLDDYGQMAGALTGLCRLEFTDNYDHYGIHGDGMERLMLDVLRAAAPSVRSLTVTPSTNLWPEWSEVVERCTEVRSLNINLLNLPVVSGMQHLHTLRLHFDAFASESDAKDIEAWCQPLLTCEALTRLSSLRSLELHSIFKDEPNTCEVITHKPNIPWFMHSPQGFPNFQS
ncbi:hypothetical protein ONE63_011356 [Megalurothrips usitatus]|uniref:Uncharacterized protein n=1 Tax=Megalurothrips usitatus TaxID=439358 RepID=A0AAV7WZR8_9NEOP|nr:hypothetical protein ONE63_011356 [Megalurothrips usitatus]